MIGATMTGATMTGATMIGATMIGATLGRVRVSRLCAVLASVALAACGSSPPTHFYTLDPVPPGSPAAVLAGPPIQVGRPWRNSPTASRAPSRRAHGEPSRTAA